MAVPKQDDTSQKMTEADYLAWEAQQEARYEFANGKIYAMSGASYAHVRICSNFGREFHLKLAGSNCFPMQSDMRVNVSAKSAYRYPDIVVVCGEPQFIDTQPESLTNPIVLIEVLSDSSKLRDRSEKLSEYINIETLQNYLIVAQDEPRIDMLSRIDAGWLYQVVEGIDQEIELTALNCILQLERIYEGVRFTLESDTNEAS